MTIKQLEYFMAVASSLSFTEAAAEMFISKRKAYYLHAA